MNARRRTWLAVAATVAAALAAYANTFAVPLLFDDLPTILDNPSIRQWRTALAPPNGLGRIKLRGQSRFPATRPKTSEVIHRARESRRLQRTAHAKRSRCSSPYGEVASHSPDKRRTHGGPASGSD